MLFAWLADAVMLLHFAFVAFAVVGAVLVLRWRRLLWWQVAAAAWAAIVELMQWPCPLTPLEIWLRQQAGQSGYSESFVEHYLTVLLYPAGLTAQVQVVLGVGVVLINAAIYVWLWWRVRA